MSPDVLGQLLPILLVVLLLFVMVIRPARRRAQQVSKLQEALSLGDEVMLSSGIYGTVCALDEDRVQVKVADGVVLTVHRGAIGQIVTDVPVDADHLQADDAAPGSATDPAAADSAADANESSTHEDPTRGAN